MQAPMRTLVRSQRNTYWSGGKQQPAPITISSIRTSRGRRPRKGEEDEEESARHTKLVTASAEAREGLSIARRNQQCKRGGAGDGRVKQASLMHHDGRSWPKQLARLVRGGSKEVLVPGTRTIRNNHVEGPRRLALAGEQPRYL